MMGILGKEPLPLKGGRPINPYAPPAPARKGKGGRAGRLYTRPADFIMDISPSRPSIATPPTAMVTIQSGRPASR